MSFRAGSPSTAVMWNFLFQNHGAGARVGGLRVWTSILVNLLVRKRNGARIWRYWGNNATYVG